LARAHQIRGVHQLGKKYSAVKLGLLGIIRCEFVSDIVGILDGRTHGLDGRIKLVANVFEERLSLHVGLPWSYIFSTRSTPEKCALGAHPVTVWSGPQDRLRPPRRSVARDRNGIGIENQKS
jgi:hypothetical protein